MGLCLEAMARTRNDLVFDLCTALELQSVELPWDERLNKDVCHVAVNDDRAKTDIRGVRFHRYAGAFDTVLVDGRIRCVSLPDVWMHYAAVLSLEELVVLTDGLMRRDRRLRRLTLERLSNDLAQATGFRGIRRCRQALRLAREGTDSSYETRVRLVPMRYGLPCPEVNHPVPKENGKGCYYLDMAYPQWKIALEYDGGHHRMQWKEDNRRREELERLGWIIIKVFYEDVRDVESQEKLAWRIAVRIEQVTGKPVPLTPRRTLEWLADGRRWRYAASR
ncbi:DUF559 domain-containing protein [Bifidobacterium sp. 82T24]|uniref:DUF559 domain-containing protein n=1 Tax=Bifidobacterium pluvialisilvae TaxID=2834436 RepID=UPI001C571684|nr:DUF559 domain-containing protein [Bifidobacterium pluvialisilvae]MBW3088034.1 DUF559 domain-containing protein [Bifidobacterium pluvialisilvae]